MFIKKKKERKSDYNSSQCFLQFPKVTLLGKAKETTGAGSSPQTAPQAPTAMALLEKAL